MTEAQELHISGETNPVGTYAALDASPEPGLGDIVRLAKRVCNAPIALVSFDTVGRLKNREGLDSGEEPISKLIGAHGGALSDELIIPDLTKDSRTRDNPLVAGAPHIRFYAGAPLSTPAGRAVGTLCVIDTSPRPDGLTDEQLQDLHALARQVALLCELRGAVQDRELNLSQARDSQPPSFPRIGASEAVGERLRQDAAANAAAQEAGGTATLNADFAAGTIRGSRELYRIFGLPTAEEYPLEAVLALLVTEDRRLFEAVTGHVEETSTIEDDFRIRRAGDGALRWISRRGTAVFDGHGKIVQFVGILQDVTKRKLTELRQTALIALGDQLRDAVTTEHAIELASQLLAETLSASRVGFAHIEGPGGGIKIERDWTADRTTSIAGMHPVNLFGSTIQHLKEGKVLAVPDILATDWLGDDRVHYQAIGALAQINVPFVERGTLRSFLFVHSDKPRAWGSAETAFVRSVADRAHAAIGKIDAEQHQRLLNEELGHRLKNTLAMVQAIASQTLKGNTDRQSLQAFNQRIVALSSAHDVLLQEGWAQAPLATVASQVLGLHAGHHRFSVEGPDLNLGPKGVLSLTMLLHELATNAVKHGALSNNAGRVIIQWQVTHHQSAPLATVSWRETGGPPAEKPIRLGFGSRLIAAGLVGTGDVELTYDQTGFSGRFRAPLSQLTET